MQKKSINSADIICDSRKRRSGLIVISGKWTIGKYMGLAEPQIMGLYPHIRPSLFRVGMQL